MREERAQYDSKVADACLKRDLGFGIIGGIAMQNILKRKQSACFAIDTALMREGLKQAVRI